MNINEGGYRLELKSRTLRILFLFFAKGSLLGGLQPPRDQGLNPGSTPTQSASLSPFSSSLLARWTHSPAFSGTVSKARTLGPPASPHPSPPESRVQQRPGGVFPSAPLPQTGCGIAGGRLRCLRGDSSSPRPPFFLIPGGGKPASSPSKLFSCPSCLLCACSTLHLLFPQIYSSTLGELGRHPASPIGLPSNYTRRSREGSGRSRPSEAGDWARITSFSTPTPDPVLRGS